MDVVWKIDGLYKADAQKVYDEITSIGDQYTAQEVVEKAKDENTELHSLFEWDNDVAADKYREQQARYILCSLVVKTETEQGECVPIRVIVNSGQHSPYRPIQMVVTNEDEYNSLLARALNELKAFQNKYSTLTELQSIFDEIAILGA